MTRTCEFGRCQDTDTEPRRSETNGEIYWYCSDHDPLQHDDAAFRDVEVPDGG